MKAMVTGATGFIGTHLIERLTADGHQVVALVRNPAAIPTLRLEGVTGLTGDVSDVAGLTNAMSGCDVVFHLARAKSHGSRPREVFVVNVDGTRNVAIAARQAGVKRLVSCSSSTVYGSRVGLVSESSRIHPDSAYARSKAGAEATLMSEYPDIATVARITAVLGPGCKSWLPLFRSASSGRLRLVGDGSNMHHPADVSDIVEGLIKCAMSPVAAGRIYNLAGPEPISMAGLRTLMAGSAIGQPASFPGLPMNVYYQAARVTDRLAGLRLPFFESVAFLTAHRVLDLTRARTEIGYAPSVDVASAARRTAEWYRGQGWL